MNKKKYKIKVEKIIQKIAKREGFNLDLFFKIAASKKYSFESTLFFYGLMELIKNGLTEKDWKEIKKKK